MEWFETYAVGSRHTETRENSSLRQCTPARLPVKALLDPFPAWAYPTAMPDAQGPLWHPWVRIERVLQSRPHRTMESGGMGANQTEIPETLIEWGRVGRMVWFN